MCSDEHVHIHACIHSDTLTHTHTHTLSLSHTRLDDLNSVYLTAIQMGSKAVLLE